MAFIQGKDDIFMTDNNSNNKRIAKNTVMLYIRMLLVIVIGLYTSRVVLEQLGKNDFGIYSVVGGVVTMFSILSSSLSSAISRFLTYEIGKDNSDRLRRIFSTSVLIQLGLGVIIAILVETGGVWFLNHKMNIAPERLNAANWVLQCSVVTFIINMLSIPYNAAIIAHENMKAFAYISVLEVVLKLVVALMLFLPLFDSLIMYSVMLVITSAIVRFTYSVYCKRHFEECRLELKFDKDIFRELAGYSSWNFIGSSSAILKDQGVNIAMNIFCGTAVNAARGLTVHINTVVNGFAQNFMLAVNPQIIKSYATGNLSYMFDLGFRSARLSFYLLLCLSLPLIVEMPYVLNLWLTEVPEYTVSFSRLVLIAGMAEVISVSLQYMNQATGKIKVYQITVGGIQMLNFPIAFLLLWLGLSPNSVYVLTIILSQVCLAARLIILHRSINLSVRGFMREVYMKVALVSVVGGGGSFILYEGLSRIGMHPILIIGIVLLLAVGVCYRLGCNIEERRFVISKLMEVLKRKKSNYA